MMKVLVSYATKMGGTAGIARTIADQLTEAGFDVQLSDCAHSPSARNFDAVVIGSAVCARRWRREAVAYLRAEAPDLAERPTWIFQSGPLDPGAGGGHVDAPRVVRRLATEIGVAEPATFRGRLDQSTARGWLARRMAAGAYAGDFRDWAQVRVWTAEIIRQLKSLSGTGSLMTRPATLPSRGSHS